MPKDFPFTLIEDVKRHLARSRVDLRGKRVLAAVSGGPDSCVLLDVLTRLLDELDLHLRICHVNHWLRGRDSADDEKFVISLAKKYDLHLTVRRFEQEEVERVKAGNIEEEARILRYDRLAHTARELNCHYIATGHTRSDQAETVLHRVIRSSGVSGLAGVLPVCEINGENVIRPLLCCSRDEIIRYANEAGLEYRHDAMNDDPEFTRTRVRKMLLPLLKEEFNPNVEESLSQLAEIARDEESFWNKHLQPILQKLGPASMDAPADRIVVQSLSLAEQRRIIRALCKQHGVEPGMDHIEDALDLLHGERPQCEIHLGKGWRFFRRYDRFYIAQSAEDEPDVPQRELQVPGRTRIKELGIEIHTELVPANLFTMEADETLMARFDSGAVIQPVTVRTRLDGDAIQPLGMDGTKKVKKILQEKKIPLEQRERVPVLCFGDQVAWVVGYCESQRFRVTAETETVLKIAVFPTG